MSRRTRKGDGRDNQPHPAALSRLHPLAVIPRPSMSMSMAPKQGHEAFHLYCMQLYTLFIAIVSYAFVLFPKDYSFTLSKNMIMGVEARLVSFDTKGTKPHDGAPRGLAKI